MMSFQEMCAVVDRSTTVSYMGQIQISVAQIRDELQYDYSFDPLQIQSIVLNMQQRGLICLK